MMFPKPIPRERKPKWGKRKEPRRKSRPGSDPGRLEFVRSLPCLGAAMPSHICRGDVQASHDRHHTGLARKEPDRKTVPMCAGLHLDEWERRRGLFEGWDTERRHYWMRDRIAEVNLMWDALSDEGREWWQAQAEVARRRRAEALRGMP